MPTQDLVQRAAGTVPVAARYKPVDLNREQQNAIAANMAALPASKALSRNTNAFITNDSLRRIQALVPGYMASMQRLGLNANDLLNGRLPFDDVDQIVGNASGRTASIGVPGSAGPATLRDLGVSGLQATNMGAGLLKDMVGIAEQTSPISRYRTPTADFVSPADRIRTQLEQSQLIQQSDQNANNLAASGDPAARLQLGLQTSGVTGYHGGDPTLGAVNTGIGSLGSSVLGAAGGGMGGGGSGASGGVLSSLMGGGSSPNSAGFYPTQAGAIAGYGGSSSYTPSVAYYGGGGAPGASTGWYLQNYTGG